MNGARFVGERAEKVKLVCDTLSRSPLRYLWSARWITLPTCQLRSCRPTTRQHRPSRKQRFSI